jgi:hypothetical protein
MRHRLDWADWFVLFLLVNAVVCLFAFGWVAAHSTVAHECKQLGGFYVGETVYECKVKEEAK